jgi:hypothetical protein
MLRSKILLISSFVLILCVGCFNQGVGRASDTDGAVYLTNCQLIDGTGAPPVDNAIIAFEGGIITEVGTSDSNAIPKGARVIDLNGATVMPGFINAHVHNAYNEQNLENWLMAGVTTVRDEAPWVSGNFLAERDRLNKDPAHARIVSASPILSVPGGLWPWFLQLRRYGNQNGEPVYSRGRGHHQNIHRGRPAGAYVEHAHIRRDKGYCGYGPRGRPQGFGAYQP